jgi:hypothetical protein
LCLRLSIGWPLGHMNDAAQRCTLLYVLQHAVVNSAFTPSHTHHSVNSIQLNCLNTKSHRVANVRKHQLLKPEIRVLVTAIDSITPSNYVFEYLDVEAHEMQQMNLQLGFPSHVVHVVRPGSPLWNLSLAEMDARMMEVSQAGRQADRQTDTKLHLCLSVCRPLCLACVPPACMRMITMITTGMCHYTMTHAHAYTHTHQILVFVDGIDAMTSRAMQARRSYQPSEMAINEQVS